MTVSRSLMFFIAVKYYTYYFACKGTIKIADIQEFCLFYSLLCSYLVLLSLTISVALANAPLICPRIFSLPIIFTKPALSSTL